MENLSGADSTVATGGTHNKHNTTEVEAPSCPVHSVVVYIDRAEVCRKVTANLKRGENEVIVKKMSPAIDKDSIRVEGSGSATITEVIYSSRAKPESQTDSVGTDAQRQLLKKQEQELVKKHKSLELAEERISKQREVLSGLSGQIASGGKVNEESGSFVSALGGETLHGVTRFFELYRMQSERLDSSLRDIEAELKQVDSELKAARANLKQLMPKPEDADLYREVKVVLECPQDTTVQLHMSYVVTHASWMPRYDLRVFTKDRKMQILYFGVIQQSTGEDWIDARLSLSTAMPSIGGAAPELPTQTLHFPANYLPVASKSRRSFLKPPGSSKNRKSTRESSGEDEEDECLNLTFVGGLDQTESAVVEEGKPGSPPPEPQLAQPTAEVKRSVTSTAYKVPRKSTIRSDSAAQKVSVAQLDLSPTFEYETVPKLAAHAFLKAKVKNESDYSLLEGPANVFLDNNFVSKTSLKPVSPKEEFECSLGVDPSVRVTYKPAKKFRQQHGILTNKTQVKVEQHIEIKNTRQDTCKIKVSDQLPVSSDDKIKVTAVEPEFRRGEKSKTLTDGSQVVLNKTNILEWMVEIEAGKSHTVKLHYNVEHPSSESIVGL